MALTATTTNPHYILENANASGMFPGLENVRMEHNQRPDNGTKDDPYIIQTFTDSDTRTLRSYLSTSGATYWPLT